MRHTTCSILKNIQITFEKSCLKIDSFQGLALMKEHKKTIEHIVLMTFFCFTHTLLDRTPWGASFRRLPESKTLTAQTAAKYPCNEMYNADQRD